MDEVFAICSTCDVDDGGARGFVLAVPDGHGGNQPWPILLTRKGNNFYGFENACPHQGSRLDKVPGEFMDEDGNFLTCGSHHAQFDLDTGHCFIGPCQGQALKPLTLVIDDGDICLTGIQLAEEDGMDLPETDEAPEVQITAD